MSSYAKVVNGGEMLVCPLDVIDRWMAKFHDRYRRDPKFLFRRR